MQRFQVARSVSTTVPKGWIAAAFTMMSSPPKPVTVFAITERIASRSVTSPLSTCTSNLACSASSASALFPSDSMPHATTRAPPVAKRSAIARPIPVVPVTKATFPENSCIGCAQASLTNRLTPPIRGLRASCLALLRAIRPTPSTAPPTNTRDSLFSQCHPPANVHGRDAWEFHDPPAPPARDAPLLPAKPELRAIYPNCQPDALPHEKIRPALASPAGDARSEYEN